MSQAKDRFIAMVAHDLRTPLNAVLGWAQLLRRGLVEAGMHAQAYATIERNARTQAELVAALLDVSRMAAGKIAIQVRTVDLGELVTRVLDAVAPIAEERRVRLEGRVPTKRRLYIQADPARMRQVLMNLVTNALKFTPAGGEICVTLDAEDGRACVQVTDTGRGIAREMLPQIFDCFRQGDGATAEENGLGLGLYIARQLVEMHHGSIAAASEGPNHGSTFTVWLPLSAAESADSGTSVSLLDDEEDLDGLRILVVEDDPDTRDILRVIFQRYGADVVTAVDAASAIGVFDGFAPQVVVSDIGLPGMDGCELIRRIRGTERGANVRALAVSGFTTKEDARRAMEAGFDAHFAKPIAAVELVRAVRARG
jgi:CheY-like chemotaxis protein